MKLRHKTPVGEPLTYARSLRGSGEQSQLGQLGQLGQILTHTQLSSRLALVAAFSLLVGVIGVGQSPLMAQPKPALLLIEDELEKMMEGLEVDEATCLQFQLAVRNATKASPERYKDILLTALTIKKDCACEAMVGVLEGLAPEDGSELQADLVADILLTAMEAVPESAQDLLACCKEAVPYHLDMITELGIGVSGIPGGYQPLGFGSVPTQPGGATGGGTPPGTTTTTTITSTSGGGGMPPMTPTVP
ncbi:MAG: hypothetical protein ACFCU3_04460 [Verrucomicrobiales bacterium]